MWVSPKLQSFPPNPTGQSQEYVSQLTLHVPPFWHGFDLQKGSLALQPNTDTEHYLTTAAANHRNIMIPIIANNRPRITTNALKISIQYTTIQMFRVGKTYKYT